MTTYDITIPGGPLGSNLEARMQQLFEVAGLGGNSDDIPIIKVDYREFAVNTVLQRAFSQLFQLTGVDWIDALLEKEGFRRSFKDNMKRMLNTGEYFALVGVRGGSIFIDRLPRDWVTRCAFHEKTGELLLLIYIEPIIVTANWNRVSWRKITWTPNAITTAISTVEDASIEEAYHIVHRILNPYGFVPVVPFKLGTQERGVPIWKAAESIIDVVNDIINDIRYIDAYHAAPTRYIKSDGEIKGVGTTGYVQLSPGDDIGALTYDLGSSLFNELENSLAVMSDILGIPITSLLAIGKHASGEAIEKRFDTLNRTCNNLRESVGEQMQLMFKMMCALISQGLVSVDVEDPNIIPLLTDQIVLPDYDELQRQQATENYLANLGLAVDLSAFKVPDVKWVPIEKINTQELLSLTQALVALIENNLVTSEEARKLLELNSEHLIVVQDLAYMDENEVISEKYGSMVGL